MLTVMTLNLNYYIDKHGAWPQRLELIHEAVDAVSPDVVAFQAVRRELGVGGGVDQAEQVARLLPRYTDVLFQPADTRQDGVVQGSAILSRLPVGEVGARELSLRAGLEDDNPRVIQHAVIQLSGQTLRLFNAHFSWVEAQARDNIAEGLALFGDVDEPALVVGDMNTPPDSPLWQPMRAAGFADAWAELRPGVDGFTFEADKPFTRIDYAWVNEALRPRLQGIELVSKERAGARLSDHLGLAVRFDLEA